MRHNSYTEQILETLSIHLPHPIANLSLQAFKYLKDTYSQLDQ